MTGGAEAPSRRGSSVPAGAASLSSPALRVLLPALLAPVAVFVAFAVVGVSPVAGRIALPVLATLAVYPVFAPFVAQGRRGAAVLAALLWALSLSASLITHTRRDPQAAGAGVLMGPAYRDEMFAFIDTGSGRESDPARFVPQHLLHAGVFAVLTLATGGLVGLAMGAVLVDYMSFYVGALAAGPRPWTAALLGWPPYAIVRVVAFVLLGAVLARPLLLRLGRRAAPRFEPVDRRLIGIALALLLLDLVLKATFAPVWSTILRPCLPR